METNCITATTDKRSSIEVTKNKNGYTKSVKIYFDENNTKDGLSVIDRIEDYFKILAIKFPD